MKVHDRGTGLPCQWGEHSLTKQELESLSGSWKGRRYTWRGICVEVISRDPFIIEEVQLLEELVSSHSDIKIEIGVMVVKDGKGWGKTYEDGHSTSYGWMDVTDAPIHEPEFCHKPTDVTWTDSYYVAELKTATLKTVRRTTRIELEIF